MKAQQVANQIALAQAVAEHQLKKIFTFHRNVASARSFTSERGEGIGTHRLDELSADAVNDLTQRLEEQFPGRSILRMSAKSGDDFTAFCEILEQRGDFGKHVMDVDYDIYAEGEAELGWLNSQIRVTTAQPFELDELLLDIIRRLRTE